MIKKTLKLFVIVCIQIQLILINAGCMSYFPEKKNKNLAEYNNSEETLVIILKNKSQLKILPKNSIFIDEPSNFLYGKGFIYNINSGEQSEYIGVVDKNLIDSSRIIERNSKVYQVYWMKNKENIRFEADKIINLTPDSGSGYWLVLDENKEKIEKLNEADVEEIQVKKINWIATSFLILTGAFIIGYIIAQNIIPEGSIFEGTNFKF